MKSFTILPTTLSFGLLMWASAAADPREPDKFAQDQASPQHAAQSVLTVLRNNHASDLLLVGRGGGRGGSGGSHQTFHSGGKHGGHHSGHHHGHHHGYHKHYSYPYYYSYPYSSYYSPGYSYDYSSPSYGSSVPAESGPPPFDASGAGQFSEGPSDAGQPPSIAPNPLPPTAAGPANIQILNPPENRVPLSYSLNGETNSLQPGQTRDLQNDRPWVIEFDRGGQFGSARYSLEPGVYTFTPTDKGWELFHQPPSAVQGATPSGDSTPFPSGTNQFSPPSGGQPSGGLPDSGFPSGSFPSGGFPSGSSGFPTGPINSGSQP